MTRPARFAGFRHLGDKRTQRCYDLDAPRTPEIDAAIDDLVASEQYAAFCPDTLAEARNRGYRLYGSTLDEG